MAKLSLYPFQREAVEALLSHDKHFIVANVGMGKSAIMLKWLEERTKLTDNPEKPNWLIVTTPAKARSGDFLSDLDRLRGLVGLGLLAGMGCLSY